MTARTKTLAFLIPIVIGLVVVPAIYILLLPAFGIRVFDAGPGNEYRKFIGMALYAAIGIAYAVGFFAKKQFIAGWLLVGGLVIGCGAIYAGTLMLYLITACANGC